MAQIVMTDEQRIALKSSNSRYQQLIQASLQDKANYWKGLDGSDVPGNDHIKWAKSRFLAHKILIQPSNIDFPAWVEQFSALTTNFTVVDDQQPYSEDAVIDYMIANNLFDQGMDYVFDLRIADFGF